MLHAHYGLLGLRERYFARESGHKQRPKISVNIYLYIYIIQVYKSLWCGQYQCVPSIFTRTEPKSPPFNPPLAGRWGEYRPPPHLVNFLNNLKAKSDIDAKLTVRYSASLWHPQTKFQRNLLRSVWENEVLVTSCHAILGRTSANIQMLLERRFLE